MHVNLHAWGSNFDRVADQVRSMMDEMKGPKFFRSHAPHSWTPRLNLYETDDRYVLCVELAGMRCEDLDVQAESGVLHIRGVRSKPTLRPNPEADESSPPVSVHLMEIDSGRFHRKVPIAGDVLVDKIAASYRQGYLWVDLPRGPSSDGTTCT